MEFERKIKMAISNIKEMISSDIHKVWETVLAVDAHSTWRSDISKTEVQHESDRN